MYPYSPAPDQASPLSQLPVVSQLCAELHHLQQDATTELVVLLIVHLSRLRQVLSVQPAVVLQSHQLLPLLLSSQLLEGRETERNDNNLVPRPPQV